MKYSRKNLKDWKVDGVGIVKCPHNPPVRSDNLICLGRYTFWPCLPCWRQIKSYALQEVLFDIFRAMDAPELRDTLNKILEIKEKQAKK